MVVGFSPALQICDRPNYREMELYREQLKLCEPISLLGFSSPTLPSSNHLRVDASHRYSTQPTPLHTSFSVFR